ncbi:hypothetical protein C1J03_03055 [Sulfitobacter sp. SK012]|nr:hypothetical protein C1J03_03055 [Sulfitobacter sp. SK012]
MDAQPNFTKQLETRMGLWVSWTLVTAICMYIGNVGAFNTVLAWGVPALLGALQWILLRRWVSRPWQWILVTYLSLTIGTMVGAVGGGIIQDFLDGVPMGAPGIRSPSQAGTFFGYLFGNAVGGLSMGLALGLGQWIVLRKFAVRAKLWIFANIFGGVGSMIVFVFLDLFLGPNTAIVFVSMFCFGAITGAALVRCLRCPGNVTIEPTVEPVDRYQETRKRRIDFIATVVLVAIGGFTYFGTRDMLA